MPSAASTSHPTPAAMPSAAVASSSPKPPPGPTRPGLLKRHSSHSSSAQGKQPARDTAVSPGSQTEGQQPLRHTVRSNKHARIVLPRNHSSGRNLPKMARQQAVAAQESAQRHGRNRSHEGDTEIRLPGSLDEGSPAQQHMQQMQRDRPPMRRNMTSYHLSRNQSHTKLKKNLSHGHLQRLNSKGNLAAMGQSNLRAPPSPGLKGKNKRPKSADMSKWALEKDLHEQEVELAQRIAEKKARGPKKVGFAVGSSGDSTAEEMEGMEGAEMEEGDWTEESASASPYSTRQNTANNSRRTSVVTDRPQVKASPVAVAAPSEAQQPPRLEALDQMRKPEAQEEEDDGAKVAGDAEDEEETETEGDDDDLPSPRSPVKSRLELPLRPLQSAQEQEQQPQLQPPQQESQSTQPTQPPQSPQKLSQAPRSPLHAAKQHQNPTMPFLRSASSTAPTPATTSNINALDNSHSTHGSPAASTMSARSTLAGDGEDELVSRFIPSTSHPGSNPVTVQNTPKSSQFHTPEAESSVPHHNGKHSRHQSNQPGDAVSPGNSTKSGSSGTVTPSIGRSRMELKMLQEKAMADIHSVVDRNPFIPAHVYDRRNESLKSYLNLAALNNNNANVPLPAVTTTNTLANSSNLSLGPEIFQGRFKAVHTELRVVQKFRDPLAESVARLRSCKGTKLSLRGSPQKLHAAALRTSKSAISLPAAAAKGKGGLHSRAVSGAAAEKGLSSSPMKGGPVGGIGSGAVGLQSSKSSVNMQQQGQRRQGLRGVSFAGGPDVGNGQAGDDEADDAGPEDLVRRLWAEIGTGAS
ncbi:hypothetical protein MBLNU13_g01161t1 [Cladosporium sp. NU13]